MGKRTFLTVLAVPAAAAVLLAGSPAAASAASTAPSDSAAGHGGYQPLTPALAAQLARNAGDPVIVILKSQLSPATGSGSAPSPSAAVAAAQASLAAELQQVHATGVKRFTLVNSVAATVSALGTPAQEQGAGLLDSDRAVQLAESYGISARTGATLLASPGQLTDVAQPGTAKTWKVTLTNEGRAAQTVRIDSRTLRPRSTSSASGSVTLSDAKSSQYTAESGGRVNYATFKFRVPAHQGRLSVSIAWPGGPSGLQSPPALALFDPDGRMAADSEPQGGGNYGNVDVRSPAGGTWTGVVSSDLASAYGYAGKVTWHTVTQNYTAFGSVSPASLTLAPGQAKSVVVAVRTPSSPGDLAGSILLHSVPKHGRANPVTTIPVVVRSEVDVAASGRFTGVLTGGNGRGALGTANYYQFTVPSGTKAIRAELALHSNPGAGNPVGTYLVSPDGDVIGYGQNSDLSGGQLGITDQTLTATALKPAAGAPASLVSGTLYLDTVQGEVPPYGQVAGDEVAALPYSYRP
jgi:hypothetical protein